MIGVTPDGYYLPPEKILSWDFMKNVITGTKELPLICAEAEVVYPQVAEFCPEMLCVHVIGHLPQLARFFNEWAIVHASKIKRDYVFHVLAYKTPGLLTFLLQRVTHMKLIKKNFADDEPPVQVDQQIVGFLQGAGRVLHKKSKKVLSGVKGPQQNNEAFIGNFNNN